MKIRILEFGLFLKVLSKCIKDHTVKAVSMCFYNLGNWEHFVLKYDREMGKSPDSAKSLFPTPMRIWLLKINLQMLLSAKWYTSNFQTLW